MMTAEGISVVTVGKLTPSVQDKRPRRRKRNLSFVDERHTVNDSKVKLVCTATVPMKRLKLPRRMQKESNVSLITRSSEALSTQSEKQVSHSAGTVSHSKHAALCLGEGDDVSMNDVRVLETHASSTLRQKAEGINDRSSPAGQRHVNRTHQTFGASIHRVSPTNVVDQDHRGENILVSQTDSTCNCCDLNTSTTCDSQRHVCASASSDTYTFPVGKWNSNGNDEANKGQAQEQIQTEDPMENTVVVGNLFSENSHASASYSTMTHNKLNDTTTICLNELSHEHVTSRYSGEDSKSGNDVTPVADNTAENRSIRTIHIQESLLPIHDSTNQAHKIESAKIDTKTRTINAGESLNKNQYASRGATQEGKLSSGKPLIGGRVEVKTITTTELVKFLNQHNLALKAVPIDESVINCENARAIKLSTVGHATNGKTRIRAAIPIDHQELKGLEFCRDAKDRGGSSDESSVVLQLRLLESSLSKVAPQLKGQGAFCSWKIGGGKTRKNCKLQRKTMKQSDGAPGTMKDWKSTASLLEKSGGNDAQVNSRYSNPPLNGATPRAMNKNNGMKLTSTSCLQYPVIPLSSAFNDIEAREQAARETVQSLESTPSRRRNISLNSSVGATLCPLSPTMRNLVNKGAEKDAVEFEADPVLTSAVAFECERAESQFATLCTDLSLGVTGLSHPHSGLSVTGTRQSRGLPCFQSQFQCRKDGYYCCQMKRGPNLETDEEKCDQEDLGVRFTEKLFSPGYHDFHESGSDILPNRTSSHVNRSNNAAVLPVCSNAINITTLDGDHGAAPNTDSHAFGEDTELQIKTEIVEFIVGESAESSTSELESEKSNPKSERGICRKRKRSGATSSDCLSQDRVMHSDPNAHCEAENRELDHDNTVLEDTDGSFKTIPLESWSTHQVTTWLHELTAQFLKERKSQGSQTSEIARNKSQSSVCFETVSGRDLCNFGLGDFIKRFAGAELAKYIFSKVQEIKSDFSEQNAMYSGGQCAVASPMCVPVTSAELEESVNFDDLLGSESILGSLELTDVFDSQGSSFLKSLSQESDLRPFSGHPYEHMQQNFHQTNINHFSPAWRCTATSGGSPYTTHNAGRSATYLRSPPPSFPPPLLHAAPYFHRRDVNFANQCEGAGEFLSGHLLRKVKIESSDQDSLYFSPPQSAGSCAPVSPSTFYNIPTPNSQTSSASDQKFIFPYGGCDVRVMSDNSIRLSLLNVPCARDATMSDTDSGIHSPESTPNKNLPGMGAPMERQNSLTTTASDTHFNRTLSAKGTLNEGPAFSPCAGLRTAPYGMPHSPSVMEVFAFPGEEMCNGNQTGKGVEQTDEAWERASTSSTSSTISVESETKLLNMDDCKTYIAEPPHPPQFSCALQEANVSRSPQTVRTPTGNVVFVPTTLRAKPGSNERHTPVNSKGPQIMTQGNITTVFPAFMSNVRRTHSVPGGDSKQFSNAKAELTTHFESTSPDSNNMRSKPMGMGGEKQPVGFCIQTAGKFTDKSTTPEYRHVSEGHEATLDDSYDAKMRRTSGKSVHLWEFIRDTLLNPLYCPRLIKWEDRAAGVFRFVQSDVVAGMWGEKKNNPKMTYEKLSRAMRYYYNRGILERVDGRRLVYKFGKNAHGWQQSPTGDGAHTPEAESAHPVVRHTPRKKGGASPKRSSSCKISVSVSHKVLPSPNKRRRQSINDFTTCNSPPNGDQKSAGTQTPSGLSTKMASVSEDPNAEPKVVTDEVTECVVFVAGTENGGNAAQDEEKIERLDVESELWPGHSPASSEASSPGGQSKLPSADVLLGKHYKIATVAI